MKTIELTDFEKAFQGMCCDKNKKFAKECCKTLLGLAPKTEWSDEDEQIIHNIRMFIEKYAISQSAVDVNGELCEKEYIDADNWLKALKQRYTWKPSKEQMEALEHFIIHHNGSTNYAKDLEELRIQLKKL